VAIHLSQEDSRGSLHESITRDHTGIIFATHHSPGTDASIARKADRASSDPLRKPCRAGCIPKPPKAGKWPGEFTINRARFLAMAKYPSCSWRGTWGTNWVHGDRAEVETKWTDYLGTIDSALRYKPPSRDVPVTMTVFVFRLVYTNKHRVVGKNGETVREITGFQRMENRGAASPTVDHSQSGD